MLSNSYALRRISQIDSRLAMLSTTLAALPEGRLHVSMSRNRTQYYQVMGKRGAPNYSKKYLGSDQINVARALAQKEILIAEYDELLSEKNSLKILLGLQQKSLKSSTTLCRRNENFYELARGDLEQDGNSWSKADFPSSVPNKEAKRIRAIDGTMVRSKSEAEIISLLVKNNLPYRYECDLIFNDRIIGCPDFTIMHPATHEIYIWEHFGLLDNLNYVRRNIYKVQSYIEAGYYPMINFIITSETADKPFDITLADSLIQQFFLQ